MPIARANKRAVPVASRYHRVCTRRPVVVFRAFTCSPIQIAARLKDDAKPATINRELAWLKHMYSLAIKAGKLMTKPHIALLREDNARQGFFEPEHLRDVLKHLPEELRPVVKFAYITGW